MAQLKVDIKTVNVQKMQEFAPYQGVEFSGAIWIEADLSNETLSISRSSINERTDICIDYIVKILSQETPHDLQDGVLRFLFQGDDRPVDVISASWQSKKTFNNICLLPDFYHTKAEGYSNFLVDEVPEWSTRRATAFWRGATTGAPRITLPQIGQLPRFQLCSQGKSIGERADFKFYKVVQAEDDEAKHEIENYLISRGLTGDWACDEDYLRHQMIVQIDGNGNSWEFVRKLKFGSCVLLVASDWVLWHYAFVAPWVHFVPVAADLSDLSYKIEWCLHNKSQAAQIAANGRYFACNLSFSNELMAAKERILGFSPFFDRGVR